MLFEDEGAKSLYLSKAPVCSLWSTGLQTGVVIDSGDGETDIISVVDGRPVMHSWHSCRIAGKDLTDYMQTLLKNEGHDFDRELVRDIKVRNNSENKSYSCYYERHFCTSLIC